MWALHRAFLVLRWVCLRSGHKELTWQKGQQAAKLSSFNLPHSGNSGTSPSIKTPKKHGEIPKSPKNLGSYPTSACRRQEAANAHPSTPCSHSFTLARDDLRAPSLRVLR